MPLKLITPFIWIIRSYMTYKTTPIVSAKCFMFFFFWVNEHKKTVFITPEIAILIHYFYLINVKTETCHG